MDQCWVHHTLQTAQWQHTTGNEYTLHNMNGGSWGHCNVASTTTVSVSLSIDVYFKFFQSDVFKLVFERILAQPHYNVISHCLILIFPFLAHCGIEPWTIAITAHATIWTFPWIPQKVSLIYNQVRWLFVRVPWFTKWIVANKLGCIRTFVNGTGAVQGGITRRVFGITCCKCPDVLFFAFFTSCHRQTGHIDAFQVLPTMECTNIWVEVVWHTHHVHPPSATRGGCLLVHAVWSESAINGDVVF